MGIMGNISGQPPRAAFNLALAESLGLSPLS